MRHLGLIIALALFTTGAHALNEHQGKEMYQLGHYEKAIEHWKQAAGEGDAGSAYQLGAIYFDGVVVKRDLSQARKYLRQAAEQNDARALTELGGFYDYGTGVRADKKRAAMLYLRAAKQGYPSAMFNIAAMLEMGDNIAQDKVEAYKYYLLSRDQGFAPFAIKALQDMAANMTPEELAEAEERANNFVPSL